MEKMNELLNRVSNELNQAIQNYHGFHSAHEGYAVLLEEVDELWDHVKLNQKKRNPNEMKKECVQIAAMAIRFALDCCDENGSGFGK